MLNNSNRAYIPKKDSVDLEPTEFGDCQFLAYTTIKPHDAQAISIPLCTTVWGNIR